LSKKGWLGPLTCPFCSTLENIDHLFFSLFNYCTILGFNNSNLPQGSLLPTTSLENFWQICLKLPFKDLQFWGSLLVVVLWSIWILQNHSIFRSSRTISVNSLFFSIFYLFSYWTCASFSVHTRLTGVGSAVNTSALGPTVKLGLMGQGGGSTSSAGPARNSISDEDLLD
jgi:hypothetical protein